MSRKSTLITVTTFVAIIMVALNLQATPSRAASPLATPGSDMAVTVEFTGIIQSLTTAELTLADGNNFKLSSDTKLPSEALTVGMTVTVSAQVDDEDFVADSISVGSIGASAADTSLGTPAPTEEVDDAGNGNQGENGNDDQGDHGNSQDNGKGHGKGNGKGSNSGAGSEDDGNGKGNGKGHGKGKGNPQATATPSDDGNGNGKGHGKGKGNNDEGTAEANDNGDHGDQGQGKGPKGTPSADCLANTTQPVATQLAQILPNASYSEIMTWHCEGNGFGEIARAYLIAHKLGVNVKDIFSKHDSGEGWRQIAQDAGISMKDLQSLGKLKAKHSKGNNH